MTRITDRTDWFQSLMPDFVGIGAMRSGTSWLATQLRSHPRVQLDRKEVHFFDRTMGRMGAVGSARDLTNRLRYAARVRAKSPRGRIRGEITPAYATLDEARVRRVRDWMPRVRIVYLLRDPIERTWSHARKHFPEVFDREVGDVARDELIEFFDSEGVRSRSDYVSCIERWTRIFPRDQILIRFYDDVVERPAELMHDVFEFIGVEPTLPLSPETLRTTIGAAPEAGMPHWIREHLEVLYAGQAAELKAVGIEPPWAG